MKWVPEAGIQFAIKPEGTDVDTSAPMEVDAVWSGKEGKKGKGKGKKGRREKVRMAPENFCGKTYAHGGCSGRTNSVGWKSSTSADCYSQGLKQCGIC